MDVRGIESLGAGVTGYKLPTWGLLQEQFVLLTTKTSPQSPDPFRVYLPQSLSFANILIWVLTASRVKSSSRLTALVFSQ